MANRIKGITVEIGGDTTKLQTALKGVNNEIKNTQSQLKDVEKLLKLDPGNTELLTQKHQLLGQAIEETKEKLQTLKTAQEQANEALKEGTITQNQYDALQREIVDTEQKLKSLEQQAQGSATALQQIAVAGEALKKAGDKISSVGESLLPVTAAVTSIGTVAVKTTADFDSAMSKVAAVSGATGDDFEALRAKAREMGAQTKFSASEAAEAMNYMAMAGWKTEDMLNGISGIMDLAAASGESLGTTSDIVTDALTAFGLTAADSGHFADVLAAASSNANTNVSMMGETFKYCAPIAGALGFSIEDTAEAIGLMANAGIKSTQAGTALRTIMNNLAGEVKICGESIGEVTIETTNADGSMRSLSDILADCRIAFSGLSESEQAAAAETLVGKNAMSGFLALMNAGESDITKLSDAIANCDGTAADMAATMQDNLGGQLTILKSQLEELAISFGDLLMPVIREIVGWIQNLVDWLNSMDEGTRKVVLTLALVIAALGLVLIFIGKVVSAVGTIMTLIPKLSAGITAVKGAFTAFSAALAANPIGLIVTAIAALVAAFIYFWNTSETFRQFWIELWNTISTTFMNVWNAIVAGISGFIAQIQTGISTAWNTIVEVTSSVLATLIETVSSIWNTILETISSIINGISSTISSVWNSISTTVSSIVTGMATTISNTFTEIWNGITSTIDNIYNTIKEGFDNAVSYITGLASSAYNWGRDIIMGIVDGISSCIDMVSDAVSNVAGTISSFLHFSVPDEGPLSEFESWMPDFMKGLAQGIEKNKSLVSKAIEGVAEGMVISPTVNASQFAMAGAYGSNTYGTGMLDAIKEALSVKGGYGVTEENNVFNVSIDAKNVKEFNDIVTISKNAQRMSRMKGGV